MKGQNSAGWMPYKPGRHDHPAQDPKWHENVLIDGTLCSVQGTTEEARQDLVSQGPMTYVDYGRWVGRWWSKGFLVDGCSAGSKAMWANRMAQNADAVIEQFQNLGSEEQNEQAGNFRQVD